MEIHEAADADVLQLLTLTENHFIDLKAIEIKPAKLSKTVSAFANASGGEIFLGIAEIEKRGGRIRSWKGFAAPEDANGHIQALEVLAQLGSHYSARFLKNRNQDGFVLHITIPKSKSILKATDGTAYVRKNAQNLPVNTDAAIKRLELDKGIVSFEDEVVAIPVEAVIKSKTITEFSKSVTPHAEPESWLQSQFLLHKDQPTVAAALLYLDVPQAALPKRSAVKIFRYKSREQGGSRDALAFDPVTIEGPIYGLIESSVRQTKEYVEEIKKLSPTGLEKVQYPDETLHEVVTNAVLHRDYSIPTDIQIRIYDNRIEVESPGKLPGHVTVRNILDEQSARNPKVVRLINKFPNPPNKDVGEGLNTAFEAMQKLRLKAPEILELENAVLVRIDHTPLASPEDTVMEYLKTHAEISNGVARELTGIRSENSMKEVFYRLNRSNLIERVEGKKGRSSAWKKK